jgi:hypothetical protein
MTCKQESCNLTDTVVIADIFLRSFDFFFTSCLIGLLSEMGFMGSMVVKSWGKT